MAFVPNANVVACHLRWVMDNEACENTLYFSTTGTIDETTMLELAEFCSSWWATNLTPILSTAIAYRETFAVSLASPTAIGVVDLSQQDEQGDVTGTRLPNESSPCISFRTAVRGRSGRGRHYLAPPTTTQMASSNLIGTTLAEAYVTAYELLISEGVAGWTWVVYSRYTNGAPRTTGLAIPVISVGFTDLLIDSQKNRKPTL